MAHIQIAEDDPDNAEMTAFICRRAGHSVRLAANGLRALERLAAERFDLLLVDVLMPGMDGLTLARTVRALPPHAEVPIIGITALAGADDRDSMRRAGMSAVGPTPIVAEARVRAIDAVLAPPGTPT